MGKRGRHRRSAHHWRCAAHWSPEPQRGFRHRERAFHADSLCHCAFHPLQGGELRRCPGGGTCLGPARRLSNNKHSRPVGGKPSIGAFFGLRKTCPILQCLTKSPCIVRKTARDGPPVRGHPDKSFEQRLSLTRSWQQGHSTHYSTASGPSRLQGIYPEELVELPCVDPRPSVWPGRGEPPGMLLGWHEASLSSVG